MDVLCWLKVIYDDYYRYLRFTELNIELLSVFLLLYNDEYCCDCFKPLTGEVYSKIYCCKHCTNSVITMTLFAGLGWSSADMFSAEKQNYWISIPVCIRLLVVFTVLILPTSLASLVCVIAVIISVF